MDIEKTAKELIKILEENTNKEMTAKELIKKLKENSIIIERRILGLFPKRDEIDLVLKAEKVIMDYMENEINKYE